MAAETCAKPPASFSGPDVRASRRLSRCLEGRPSAQSDSPTNPLAIEDPDVLGTAWSSHLNVEERVVEIRLSHS
jgi:hypothetical protein